MVVDAIPAVRPRMISIRRDSQDMRKEGLYLWDLMNA